MREEQEALLARIVDLFAERFDKRAVLRGGMALKLLGSRRYTNDLDYVFVSDRSKKEIVDDVLDCLGRLEGATVTHSLHSKCLRVGVSTPQATAQVEAGVTKSVAVFPVATRRFSTAFDLPSRLVNVVELRVALAEKMAAWNERRPVPEAATATGPAR